MHKKLAFWTGTIGVTLFIVSTIFGGLLLSNYSHISQFISESYAIDTPYGKLIRYVGFLPSGICLTIFAFSSVSHFKKATSTRFGFWGLGIFYGFATIIVSIFPCDKGCNKELIDPTISQLIHNLTGLLTYIFIPFSLILIGLSLRKEEHARLSNTAIGAGLSCILFTGILMADPLTAYAGLFQRIIEGSILFWIMLCSIHLKSGIGIGRLKNAIRINVYL